MEMTPIIVAVITTIGTVLCAYLTIVPQIKKNKITVEDIENAVDNSQALKDIKAGLKSEMRKSLIEEYWDYSSRGFEMSQAEVDDWDDDVAHYKALGGNGVIEELDRSMQISRMERERSKHDQRVIKL